MTMEVCDWVPGLIAALKEVGDWCWFEEWEYGSLNRLAEAGLLEIERFDQPCEVTEENGLITEFAFRARAV